MIGLVSRLGLSRRTDWEAVEAPYWNSFFITRNSQFLSRRYVFYYEQTIGQKCTQILYKDGVRHRQAEAVQSVDVDKS